MLEYIQVREVGLRDGLQLIKTRLNTATKKEWLRKQINAGFKEIEISSIVPKKTFPQFADATEMINFSNEFPNILSTVLIPNIRGAELAFQAKAKKVIFVISASEAHNLANVKMSIKQSLAELQTIIARRACDDNTKNIKIIGSISTSFGCSISGKVPENKVLKIVDRMLGIGVDEISIADTVGHANPRYVSTLFKKVVQLSETVPVIGHFHDTQGFGLANVVAAIDQGVKKFDASLRGLGGCPYAPGATGNIATEDCINLIESMGYNTGVSIKKLAKLCKLAENWLPNEQLHGKLLDSPRLSTIS